jgi:hypothetical protein
MAEQDLNRSQVDAALDEVGRETVTKGVAMDCLAQARRTPRLSDPLAGARQGKHDGGPGGPFADSAMDRGRVSEQILS